MYLNSFFLANKNRFNLTDFIHEVFMDKNTNIIEVNPLRIILILSLVVVILIFASILGNILNYVFGHNFVYGFVPKFNLDEEGNVPTFITSLLLIIPALLLWIIAKLKADNHAVYVHHWYILAFIFFILSIDESAGIHELMIIPLRNMLQTSGIFYFAWVLPAIILILIFILTYIKFLLALPVKTRYTILIAAIIYIGGALGFELIGGYQADINGQENMLYSVLTTIEESLEMIGLLLFIYALLTYIRNYSPNVLFHIKVSSK